MDIVRVFARCAGKARYWRDRAQAAANAGKRVLVAERDPKTGEVTTRVLRPNKESK